MKITRILPKPLARAWQEYDLDKAEAHLRYHEAMAQAFRQHVEEARIELERLRRLQ